MIFLPMDVTAPAAMMVIIGIAGLSLSDPGWRCPRHGPRVLGRARAIVRASSLHR
jgi:hypothetical protein